MGHATQFFEVQGRQGGQTLSPTGREKKAHRSVIIVVGDSPKQPGTFGPVHQADHAVMTEQQRFGDIAQGRTPGIVMSSHGQQQLVLCRGQPGRSRLRFAPPLKPPEAGTEDQEPPVHLVG